LIADEIAVGFGRTGTFFACEQAQIWPDFLTLSKGLSAGYLPLSVVMTTNAIYSLFYSDEITRGFLHSHTFTGNPLACCAALASLDIFAEDDVVRKNQKKAQLLDSRLAELARNDKVENFRRCGMVWAFEVPVARLNQSSGSFAGRFFAAALENELLLRPIDNTVYLMPPYILDENEMDFLAAQTLKTLEDVFGK
jgi:adenosylmethionine-8-amino-7-oxononanoate aminotransferase